MYRRPINLIVACFAVLALIVLPAESQAGRIWDCMFGNAPPSQTTYTPTFAPAYVAPAYVAPSCAPCVPSCSPCVQQSCQYMPSVVYSALYQPAAVGYYSPAAVTTYRPFLGTYQTRLVPYTTYRPIYVPSIAYQSYYTPSTSCGPIGCGASYSGYVSPCSSCGVTSSGCTSCSAAAQPAPQTVPQPAPQTFDRKTEKPATNDNLQPIPQPDVQLNSTPAPALPDPNDRRASRSVVHQAARIQPAGYVAPAPIERDDGGWHPVRN